MNAKSENNNANILINSLKETAIEMVKQGATIMQCAETIGKLIGNDIARLIMCDIALDLGKKEEVKKYLATFGL